ncbi:vWA domain-containing protein [Planctomicrobium piriforme]|uniref:Putative Flp pilus-assembly TadE/G-like n=1 Tax=Planctomicrobium piriforme TaxID=1576369 RepID=A0A1I3QCC3_9PLAN|nr:vWA domain-containing protein [Planctomicrobium piriforme]SFJ31219.1 Putative Flp pilus-assembly TadE/G-like [Planctomicrobium piriforme]
MRNLRHLVNSESTGHVSDDSRQGSVLILTCLCLMGLLAAAALSVDVGYIQVQKSRMQNAVDAAALAAAQEITNAVRNAPAGTTDPTAYALGQARTTAAYVAGLGGIYVDPNADVTFGQRQYNASTKTWATTWNKSPANTVKVIARRTGTDATKQDGKLKLFFGGAIGTTFANVKTEATAFVQARDIAVVHDFSRSMNFDSHFPLNSEQTTRMADSQVVANMQLLWNDLQPVSAGNMTFTPQYLTVSNTANGATTTCKFMYTSCYVTTTTSFSKIVLNYSSGSTTFNYTGTTKTATVTGTKDVTSVTVTTNKSGGGTQTQTLTDSDANVLSAFSLTGSYPYPDGSWSEFITHCRSDEQMIARGYRESYGGLCMVNYILRSNSSYSQTPALSTARHYPFSAIKSGHSQLCSFLQTLSFDDRLGMVSYDTNHRIETILNSSDPTVPSVNISSNPLSDNFTAVNNLMKYKQANYYSPSTNMGGGLGDGTKLLDNYSRAGTQPTILLMTDGNSNVMDSGASGTLPTGWDWNVLFDFDGDGVKDYSTSDSQARYVLKQAKAAVDKGYVIHTICVGADADTDLLKAVAWMGGGLAIVVPATSSSAEMEAQLLVAFQQIASMVPPAKLLNNDGT